jgi:high-affinity Fe2+/Pb2+ permease
MEQARRPAGAMAVESAEPAIAGVSWAAVVAGAVASCALTLVLLSFGSGVDGTWGKTTWGKTALRR